MIFRYESVPSGSPQAQIEDGHGMAERVSFSVRRLDDIQMRVQRTLALVEDVINLRGCAEVKETTVTCSSFNLLDRAVWWVLAFPGCVYFSWHHRTCAVTIERNIIITVWHDMSGGRMMNDY